MALPRISWWRRQMAALMTFWIPFKAYRKCARHILYMGVRRWWHVRRTDQERTFPHELSIVAIMKDEGPYLKEWLDFHILVGVEKFYLYDNGSTDNTRDVIAPYVRRGVVEWIDFPGPHRQNLAYIDALNRFSEDTRWMAFLDLDEFCVPTEHRTIPEFLHTLPDGFGALVMTWIMYGSSGHRTRPDGLVIENYMWRGDARRAAGCKSIVNPRRVVWQKNPHVNRVAGFLVDENGKKLGRIDQTYNPPSAQKIRVNHYVTKSYDEYIARGAAGIVAWGTNTRTPEKFARYDTNDVYDDIMKKFIPQLKKKK